MIATQVSLSRRNGLFLVLALAAVALSGSIAFLLRGGGAPRFVEYRMAEAQESPTAIAAGADGAVWFTIDRSDSIGRVLNGAIERVSTSGRNIEPLGLGVAPDGSAFFTDAIGGAIARVSRDGQISRFKLDTPIVRLGRLAVAPDGSAWFAESTEYSITQLKDGSLIRHEVESPRGDPFGVAVAPSGVVWATLQSGDQLLRIGADGHADTFDVPHPGAVPTDIAVGPDGSAWFIEIRGNRIGRLHDGKFAEFEVGVENAGLSGIAVAGDGSVWFGMLRKASLGRLRDGKVAIFPLPRKDARPFSVAVDPANNVWYADISGYVGMLTARFARD
jgi:virginiamycin B lyase